MLCSLAFVSSCTKQYDDEKFEFIITDFPKLGDVPNRPKLPNMNKINQDQERLNQDQEEANKKKQEIFKTLNIDTSPQPSKSEQE